MKNTKWFKIAIFIGVISSIITILNFIFPNFIFPKGDIYEIGMKILFITSILFVVLFLGFTTYIMVKAVKEIKW